MSANFLLVWSSMKVSMKSLSEYFCLDDGMVDAGSKTRENNQRVLLQEHGKMQRQTESDSQGPVKI